MSEEDPSLPRPPANLEQALQHVINCWNAESDSGTPDFVLAQYLMGCLAAWNEGIVAREAWYGRAPGPAVEPPIELAP